MKAVITFFIIFGIYFTNMGQLIPQEPPYEEVAEEALPALTKGRERDPDFLRLTPKHIYVLDDGRALLDGMLFGKIYPSKKALLDYLTEMAKAKGYELSDPPFGIPIPEHDTITAEDGVAMIDGPPKADLEIYQKYGCLAMETSSGKLLVATDGDYFLRFDKQEYIHYRDQLKEAQENRTVQKPRETTPQLWYTAGFPDELQDLAGSFLKEIGLESFPYHFSSLPRLDSATEAYQKTHWLETKDYLALSAIIHLVYLAEFPGAKIEMHERKPSTIKSTPNMDDVPEPVVRDAVGNEFILTSYFWVSLNPAYNDERAGAYFSRWMPRTKQEYDNKLSNWKRDSNE